MAIPRPTSPLFRSLSVAGCGRPDCRAVRHQRPGGPRRPLPLGADDLSAGDGTAEGVQRAVREGHGAVQRRSDPAHEAHGPGEDRSAKATAAAKTVSTFRSRIKQLVASESRSDPFGTFGAMLSSDSPGDFVSQASIIDVVSSRRAAVLAEASKASAAAAKAAKDAKAAQAAAAKLTHDLSAKRTQLSKQAAQSKAMFDRLSASERQTFLDSQAAPPGRPSVPERHRRRRHPRRRPLHRSTSRPAEARRPRSRRPSRSSAARTCGPPPDRPLSTARA